MDQRKVEAVKNWPQPTTIKEMQRFLGFANFYRRFIAHYSQLAAPLTSLLRQKVKSLTWTPEAHRAFTQLKSAFCTAPALSHPDPNLRFVVEVDAATLGVGAVLSQWKGETPVLHPCAYFSRKLSPAEQNYDVGNRELLAIKLALEEWRHWLEGAQHPFVVITDHKNLQYLQEAKRLNPRQARWALFFTRSVSRSLTVREVRTLKLMLSPACTNLTQLQMNQSTSYHIPSSRHLFCGNSTTKSKPPLLPNLLRQEVQKGRTMSHPTCA